MVLKEGSSVFWWLSYSKVLLGINQTYDVSAGLTIVANVSIATGFFA